MSDEFNIKNGFISNSNSRVIGTLTATTLNVQTLGGGTLINNIGVDINGNVVTGVTTYGSDYLPLSGGTVYGNTIFTSGLTANTISITNYIDFNTGTTTPTNVSGRVYFDNQSHSLAYFPDIDQNVKVEMGQQLYIRGFNNTGSIIPKGTVLSIQSATNGSPNFTPTVNIHTVNSQVIGLAASDIPINGNGLALSQGILSGITINTFSVGDILYSSPFSPGAYIADTTSFPFSARTNQIGFVIATGTTDGQIYVSINNEDENLTLTDIERNILEGNVISTGAYEFTGITIASSTTIDIAPMRGWIVRNTYDFATSPDVTNLYYSGGTNIPVSAITTADATYILITSASTLIQQTTFPTPQERRENILLGKVIHPNRSTIQNINNTVDFDVSPMSALRDLWTPLKLINQGVVVSPNGANLNINTSAGTLWGNGINWVSNQLNPDSVSISGTSPTTFQYRVQTGGTFSNRTTIDVANYDLNGVVTAVGGGSNSSTNQRVYLFPTGVVRIQYGQQVHATLAEAVSAAQTEPFIEYSNNRDNGILIGIISVNKTATLLNNTAQARFTFVSKFGELLGGTGGLSTTTLQQAYENSTTPEIITNTTLGALSIKNGTGNADNVTNLLEGVNAAGNTTSFIRADGDISGTTIQTNGFTANTTGVSATTVNIRTIGSGTPIVNIGVDSLGNVVSGKTDITLTGGTYINGVITLTNNTGGTFNVTTTTTYSAGVISGATYTSTGTGQVNLPAIKVALYNNANNIEPILVYDIASGTTGVAGIPALVDQDTNYIVVEYNGGSPRYYVYDNDGLVDDSSVVLFMIVYRGGTSVHTLEFGNQGAGLANKLNDRFIMTDRFGWESGLTLGLSGSTGVVTVTAGVAWNGPNRQSLSAVNSSGSTFFKNYHTGGVWTYTTTGTTLNNTYYDDGTDIVLATGGKYLTNWYFRGQEINSHIYEVYGTSQYDSVALAQLSTEPLLPELVTSHAILVGRIIVLVGASTGLTESAFTTVFQATQVTAHNDLNSIQGGTAGEYYHLTSNQYNNLPLKNSSNTFTQGQIFNSGITANTISATTYNNLPTDIYVTGGTFNGLSLTLNRQNGSVIITGFTLNTGTTNEIAYFPTSSTISSLSTSTYPSLTELSYVKGVTSAIQTQIDNTYIARVQSVVSSATVTPTFANDEVIITAQAVNLTLNNPTGTATEGKSLIVRIKDNGTARSITFDTQYRAVNVNLPTSTTASRTLYLGMIYNATDTRWDVTGVALENANPDNTVQLLYYSNNC